MNHRNIGTKEALWGLEKVRWSDISINNVYTHTAVLSMPGRFSSGGHQSSPAWTPTSSQVQVTVAPVCSAVWFSAQSCDASSGTGVKAGKSTSCSSWPKSHTTSSSRKEKSWRLGTCWNAGRTCLEHTGECARLSAHIHTWWKQWSAATSHSVLNICKQMLNQQDTSSCFASCSLCLFFQKCCFSEETPWKPPRFLTPLRAHGKWTCDTGAKSSAANLPHLPQSLAAAKLKIAATGKPRLKMRTFIPLFQADNGVTVDMFGHWKER